MNISIYRDQNNKYYLVNLSEQQKNWGILNLQVELVAGTEKRMSNICSLKTKFVTKSVELLQITYPLTGP